MKMPKKELPELESETVETQWDIKRLLIGAVILIVFGSIGFIMLFPGDHRSAREKEVTLGVSSNKQTREVPPLPDQEDVENIISDAQQKLSEISSENLESSDSAIQKIINDLQSLQKNRDVKGAFCSLVCTNN